jgi:hypothetical protein
MNRSLITAYLFGALLVTTAVVGNFVGPVRGESVSLNYPKIKFDYVTQDDKGITFGGDSTFPALPAVFFGPGSEPFDGSVVLKGKKILQNVVLERRAGAVFGASPTPQDIPLEMVGLSLASVQPIVVTYSGGATELWDMEIDLDKDENSSCWIRVSHFAPDDPDGGVILPAGSFFDIFADVTFSHTPAGGATRHRFFSIIDRTQLTTSDATWAHQHNSIAGGANREFIPGADPADPSAPLQVLLFEGGGLDLPLRVVDVVPEPLSLMLFALGTTMMIVTGRR